MTNPRARRLRRQRRKDRAHVHAWWHANMPRLEAIVRDMDRLSLRFFKRSVVDLGYRSRIERELHDE